MFVLYTKLLQVLNYLFLQKSTWHISGHYSYLVSPTVHILNASFLWCTHFWSWSLQYQADELNKMHLFEPIFKEKKDILSSKNI